MSFFENGIRTAVMSTELVIEANVAKKVLFECLALAKEFESKYSAYKSSSLLSSINAAAGKHAVSCTKEELEIFEKALEIAKLSDGLFDPTIGALTQGLYGFGTNRERLPSNAELAYTKALVNYKLVKISDEEIYLPKRGMRFDLGGIGKGYVADKIIEYLQNVGATKGLVSVGGEICSFGRAHTIAIKNPFSNGHIAIIHSSKELISISTSGDYERYIGSKEHHHILDNKTATQNHYYSSVTILKNGLEATKLDGVATIVFNSKPEELNKIAKNFEIAIIAITPNKDICFENFMNLNIKNLEMFPFTDE